MQHSTIKYHLQQISDMLVLNGILTECPGWVHGKMGYPFSFSIMHTHYTGNMLFADYAIDLIGKMKNQTN